MAERIITKENLSSSALSLKFLLTLENANALPLGGQVPLQRSLRSLSTPQTWGTVSPTSPLVHYLICKELMLQCTKCKPCEGGISILPKETVDRLEKQGHHPTLTIMYNKLKVTLTTHAASGFTENDFIMAKLIDSVISNS